MVPIWKEAPFVRIILPFTIGITVQFSVHYTTLKCLMGASIACICLSAFGFINLRKQYRAYWIYGLCINVILFFLGMLVLSYKENSKPTEPRTTNQTVVAKIEEPLSMREKSYKAVASFQFIVASDSAYSKKGKIILYFKKQGVKPPLEYGDQIIFRKELQLLTNTGNPGCFDYRRYCEFQQIYFQVFLANGDYQILIPKERNQLKRFLFGSRKKIIAIIQKYIPGKKEAGLAEALLIGYKDDLDKNLVQSYSDTGVVHIIAISGLHVGLIYWLLNQLFHSFSRRKERILLKSIFIIAGLWLFSFLAGGTPSVLRSTVMFTFIVLGDSLSKKACVYNSLAASAFLLLCYNPFWLWDVGFQLSYAAVVSIIVFMKPIYNWCYIDNKILDAIWKLNAVTLSAQVLTIPICLYYFHQFPTYFLLANLIAVPLSSLILLGELILCAVFFLPAVGQTFGWILFQLIRVMNTVIERIQSLPYSVIENIQFSSIQLVALYIIIIGFSTWVLIGKKMAFLCALFGALFFGLERVNSNVQTRKQQRLIVYNIPGYHAMDFISGNKYLFKGDSSLLQNNLLSNFHLKPSRIVHHSSAVTVMTSLFSGDCWYLFNSRKIIVLQRRLKMRPVKRLKVDILILSKNVKMSIIDIQQLFDCKEIIFDSSNSNSRISSWRTECESQKIPCYSVPDKGAFVKTVN